MLKIKYIENFKGNEPFLVITSDRAGFMAASEYFNRQDGVYLCNNPCVESCNVSPLNNESLYLSADECKNISDIFTSIVADDKPKHFYFDIKSLSEVEILISYSEYKEL